MAEGSAISTMVFILSPCLLRLCLIIASVWICSVSVWCCYCRLTGSLLTTRISYLSCPCWNTRHTANVVITQAEAGVWNVAGESLHYDLLVVQVSPLYHDDQSQTLRVVHPCGYAR